MFARVKNYGSLTLLYLLIFACAYTFRSERVPEVPRRPNQLRILTIGDSTTQGLGAEVPYSHALQKKLQEMNPQMEVEVINLGRRGVNSGVAADQLQTYLDKYKPDAVVSMLGLMDFENDLKLESSLPVKLAFYMKSLSVYPDLLYVSHYLFNSVRNPVVVARDFVNHLSDQPMELSNPVEACGGPKTPANLKVRRYQLAQKLLKSGASNLQKNAVAKAQDLLATSIAQCPGRHAHSLLATIFRARGDLEGYERNRIQAIELSSSPRSRSPMINDLAGFYLAQGRLDEAEKLAQRGLDEEPDNAGALAIMAGVFTKRGDIPRAQVYQQKIAALDSRPFPMFENNYSSIADQLKARDVQLFAMQYPGRSIAQLKRIMKPHAQVRLVNNEAFNTIMDGKSYGEFFTDRVGGTFGHGTPLSDELLGLNVAHAVQEWLVDTKRVPQQSPSICDSECQMEIRKILLE